MTKPDLTKARAMLRRGYGERPIDYHTHAVLEAICDAIDPQPVEFDWAGVKPGMAFKTINGRYIGHFVEWGDGKPWFRSSPLSAETGWNHLCYWEKEEVVRAPEHDKVQP